MSSQSDLNAYPVEFILYYCGAIQADQTLYQLDLSDVCDASYNLFTGNLQIDTWYIGAYVQPSMATLMTYDLDDVLTWFDNFYVKPGLISNMQFFPISSTDLAQLRVDFSMIGFCIFNTTTQVSQYLDSNLDWVDMYTV